MLVGFDLGEDDQSEAEHAGEHDPHHRILLHPAVLLQIAGQKSAGQSGREGTDGQRQAERECDDDARQDGVGDRIPHERPALEHEIAGQHRADRPDQHRNDQRTLHERIAQRHRDPVEGADHACAPASRRRRAARSPCLGAP